MAASIQFSLRQPSPFESYAVVSMAVASAIVFAVLSPSFFTHYGSFVFIGMFVFLIYTLGTLCFRWRSVLRVLEAKMNVSQSLKSSVANWLKTRPVLYLSLDHANNRLEIIDEKRACRTYSVSRNSRANFFGVWLFLKNEPGQGGATGISNESRAKLRRLFISRWQIQHRHFRALHRHLIWYID